MTFLNYLIFSIFFFLPAGIANSTPVLAVKIKFLQPLDKPIDGGKTFRGVRIFGDHKTVRGFLTGTLTAILTTILLYKLYQNSPYLQSISPIDYEALNPVILGFLLGFGALLGDAIKSFFKRRTSIPPGKSWFPFDQLDYIIGGLLFSSFYAPLTWQYYLIITLIWFGLHLLFTFIGYLAGLKEDPI